MPSQENPMQLLQKNWTLKQSVPISKILWQTKQITPQQNTPQTRRVRNTRATTQNQHTPIPNQDTQQDNNDETVDLKNTFFIQEGLDSWNTVNFIKPKRLNNEPQANTHPIYQTKSGYEQPQRRQKSTGLRTPAAPEAL